MFMLFSAKKKQLSFFDLLCQPHKHQGSKESLLGLKLFSNKQPVLKTSDVARVTFLRTEFFRFFFLRKF